MRLRQPFLVALLAVTSLVWTAPDASAVLITFGSRAAFNAAAGPLPTETFEEGNVAPGAIVGCPGLLDENSNNACFSPGDILPGLQLVDRPGPDDPPPGLALAGAGVLGHASKAVYANFFVDSLDLNFSGANAVGFDALSARSPSLLTVSVFGPGGLLGAFAFPADGGPGVFFGVISDGDPIVRINIDSATDQAEGVDDVSFGRQVPEPATLAVFALGLAGVGLRRRRS